MADARKMSEGDKSVPVAHEWLRTLQKLIKAKRIASLSQRREKRTISPQHFICSACARGSILNHRDDQEFQQAQLIFECVIHHEASLGHRS